MILPRKKVRALLPVFFWLRLGRLFRRKGCIILCFHGIGENDGRFLPEQQYRKIVAYLERNYRGRYLLTFDDGYDNVLFRDGIKFVNTAYFGQEGYISKNDALFLKCGSHSHDHVYLTHVQPKLLWAQLKLSHDILKTPYLAFPFGAYNEKVKKAAREAGYKFLFGTDCNDPEVYPRFVISNTTTYESNVIRMLFTWEKYRVSHLPPLP